VPTDSADPRDPSDAADAADAAAKGKLSRPARRQEKEAAILREAEAQFARFGFEGASLEAIAAALGLSRHHLLYYFRSKEQLYRRVLDDVMGQWLEGMAALAQGQAPAHALCDYIAAKLDASAQRPEGTRVFSKEVIAGAPRYADGIRERVAPLLQADVRQFERWARRGEVRRLNYTHLMFVLWAVTQAYADHAAQFALLLGKPALDARDFAAAQRVIETLVLAGLGLGTAVAARAPGVPPPPAQQQRRAAQRQRQA
jgi:TetR/AcrR family transcriptional regulator